MQGFKKLILASAIVAASGSAMAMQAMDDESMASTTGQDGLTVKLDVNMQNLNIRYIDRDGIVGDPDYGNSGGIEISPIGITARNQTITIDAGGIAGTAGGTEAQLLIGIQMGTAGNSAEDIVVDMGGTTIAVADAAATGSNLGARTNIVTFDADAELRIAAGASMTIRLGNRQGTYTAAVPGSPEVLDSDPLNDADADGNFSNDVAEGYAPATAAQAAQVTGDHLIEMVANIPSLSLTGITVLDAVGGGEVGIGRLGVTNMSSNVGIDVVPNGLLIDTSGSTVDAISLENLQVGTVDLTGRNDAIGDLYITGAGGGSIVMNNRITISGH